MIEYDREAMALAAVIRDLIAHELRSEQPDNRLAIVKVGQSSPDTVSVTLSNGHTLVAHVTNRG